MSKQTIDRIDVAARRVLMRVDFNVPLDGGGAVTDDRRIRAALPSIRSVIDRGGCLVLMSHLGRPKGDGPEAGLSLRPAWTLLATLLPDRRVHFVEGDCVGSAADALAGPGGALVSGETLVLDNLRFHREEKNGDPAFAAKLAAFGEIYCNDAFGTAHRRDASMVAVPQAMAGCPRVCGLLLRRELEFLGDAIARAAADGEGDFLAVLGGAKVSDKLGAIHHLTGRVDGILIGGAMAYTFLAARGLDVGSSRVEADMVETARGLMDEAAACRTKLVLPSAHVCGRARAAGTETKHVRGAFGEGWMGLDIGPETARAYADAVSRATTVVWNGPLGVFEIPPFDRGTRQVAEALAAATAKGAVTIVGGGDSAAAIEAFGLAEKVSHVSTGGGASLRMLEGRPLESVDLLDDA